jgi:hypothetical protein
MLHWQKRNNYWFVLPPESSCTAFVNNCISFLRLSISSVLASGAPFSSAILLTENEAIVAVMYADKVEPYFLPVFKSSLLIYHLY